MPKRFIKYDEYYSTFQLNALRWHLVPQYPIVDYLTSLHRRRVIGEYIEMSARSNFPCKTLISRYYADYVVHYATRSHDFSSQGNV